MSRLAIVLPAWSLRAGLVRVADLGCVELDRGVAAADTPVGAAARAFQRVGAAAPAPCLTEQACDLAALESAAAADRLAGEAQLEEYTAQAVTRDDVAALVGWAPTERLPELGSRLEPLGGSAVELRPPRGVQPPTIVPASGLRASFSPLVSTYATVPYADIDPTPMAGLAYMVMFGAMFGDVGHGLLVMVAGLAIRRGRPAVVARLRAYWRFVFGAGLFSAIFGALYGECFGPTGLVPTLWLSPMEHPVPLLFAGVGLGTVLLGGAYAIGTVNRWREGGWALALYAPSGIAGSTLFLAAGLAVLTFYVRNGIVGTAAVVLAAAGLTLAFVGFLAAAGRGAAGALQAVIELFDLVIRLGANVVSFARLAAFGLTHAVLGWIVWSACLATWRQGPMWWLAAGIVFVLGNAVTFSLEALVAGVQALRLEYYELFSRVFLAEGRPFRPWHVPTVTPLEEPC
jgi:V/A-type H+-transporting ATPase subunit I